MIDLFSFYSFASQRVNAICLISALLQAVRALMIVGIVLGVIGDLIAIFALKCLKMGNMEDNIKATMSLTAGVMFILGGVLMIFIIF